MDEIIEYIYKNYSYISNKFSREQVKEFVFIYKSRMVVIQNTHKIDGVAFYFRLYDETLEKIKSKRLDLSNPINVNRCLKETGQNIHFFMVIANGIKTIIKGLEIIKSQDIKTISWFSPDMKKFFIRRLSCHQSLLEQQ